MKAKRRFSAALIALTIVFCVSMAGAAWAADTAQAANAPHPAKKAAVQAAPEGPKDATPATAAANLKVYDLLPFQNLEDFDNAQRGFIAKLEEPAILGPSGWKIWDFEGYSFLSNDKAPATVNPSLWRQARLNMNRGLFKVADRIYQVRGNDLSNMSFIVGDTGISRSIR